MFYSEKEPDENHEFAISATYGGVVHIYDVKESGRNDFVCIGCGKPMLAILRKIYGMKPYFRHDVQDVPVAERCSFSNELYRRKIALDTLQLEKQLRVPPLYKMPPKGNEGLAIKLHDAETIHFTEVKRNQSVFELPDGSITFSREDPPECGELLMTADAVCYNADEEPVLLVLISDGKRRKMDVELMATLARLRVNTVTITPAKSSAEDIYKTVLSGKNTQWLYNYDERQFDYFSLSADLDERVPVTDVDQGLLFDETYDCRKTQINNLIRAVNKCLGGEPYRKTEQQNRRIIGETEFAIRRAGERRDELEERYREASDAAHSDELGAISERRKGLSGEQAEFSRVYQDLEERYFRKKRELEATRKTVESNLRAAEITVTGGRRSTATLRRELEQRTDRARDRMDELFTREQRSVDGQRERTERTIATAGSDVGRIRQLLEKGPASLERLLGEKATEFDSLEAAARTGIEQLQTERANLPERFAGETASLGAEFEELRRRSTAAAENRTTDGSTGFAKRFKGLLDGRGYVVAVQDARADHKRYRIVKDFLESAAGEAWLQAHST